MIIIIYISYKMVLWVRYYIIALVLSFLFIVFNFILHYIFLIDSFASNLFYLGFPKYISEPFNILYSIIKYLNYIFFWILIVILNYIFISWIIVLFFVPPIVIVFVFFIPIPIPLKFILLSLYTDILEVLLLIEKILNIFIDTESFADKFKSIGNTITNYIIKIFNDSSKTIFPFNPLIDIEKFIDIKKKDIINNTDYIINDTDYNTAFSTSSNIILNTNDKNKYKYDISLKNIDEYYKNTFNIINNERQNCITGNITEINSGMSIIDKNIINTKNTLASYYCHNNAVQSIIQLNLTL